MTPDLPIQSGAIDAAMDRLRRPRAPDPYAHRMRLTIRHFVIALSLCRLGGHSQQIDDIGFAFERSRIGLDEAMIDCNLADLAKLVFADTDVRKAAR